MSTLFEKIISREIPADIVFEDDLVVAFRDIQPQAPIHILIVPIKPIRDLFDVNQEDEKILARLLFVAHKIGNGSSFRLVINNGEEAGQIVPHLHVHLLAGRAMKWPPG